MEVFDNEIINFDNNFRSLSPESVRTGSDTINLDVRELETICRMKVLGNHILWGRRGF